ncbi:hypothetical protein PV333_43405 [Streptomyces sp. NY05-11A]|nr:hypothetical protein [Streptomyces sp. NY05-11A]MDX2683011.1 hypothetical protein [Streptomyces sp. NY05-11A]
MSILPVLHEEVATLADHLRKALETAFGIAPAEGPSDPMLLRVAVLTLLTEVSRRKHVVLTIDDVQHFDRDSLDVLLRGVESANEDGVHDADEL